MNNILLIKIQILSIMLLTTLIEFAFNINSLTNLISLIIIYILIRQKNKDEQKRNNK